METNRKYKILILLSFLLTGNLPIMAQSSSDLKSQMNEILNNFALPVFLVTIVLGAILGFAKNWEKISDNQVAGSKKEGLINVGYIVMYAAIIGVCLSAIMQYISTITISI